jgi:broad specificity phosphatase PhoE
VDIPLDEAGVAQARATAKRVAEDWKASTVVCSPLRRAVQTAEIIAHELGQTACLEAGLLDINFGDWQGLSPAIVSDRWPDMANAWLTAPHTVQFPGGESLDRVKQRSMAALHALIERYGGADVVAVAHTVVNRVVMCAVLGLDNSHHWRIGQDTCAINVFRWHEGVFYVDSLNDTCHLRCLT